MDFENWKFKLFFLQQNSNLLLKKKFKKDARLKLIDIYSLLWGRGGRGIGIVNKNRTILIGRFTYEYVTAILNI